MLPQLAITALLTLSVLVNQEVTSRPASQPLRSASQRSTVRRAQQLEIYQQLLREQEQQRPILPQAQVATSGPTADKKGVLLEGTMIIQRSGRLVRRGQSTQFEFESPGPELPATIEIVKNALLEQAENASERGGDQFVITGEVTRYRGQNYLLLIQVSAKLDHGNVKP